MSTRVQEIAALDVEDYREELGSNLGASGASREFDPFLHEANIIRTLDVLTDIKLHVEGQLAKFVGAPSGEEWERKARGYLAVVDARLQTAHRRHGQYELGKRDSSAKQSQGWRRFAHQLCEALEISDMDPKLDEIMTPYGDLTAAQWLARRLEKRAGLAVAA